MKDITNKEIVIFELTEAIDHLNSLVKEVEEDHYEPDGEDCYSTALRHIYEHLNWSYHYCDKTEGEIESMTQEDFSRLSNTLPEFHNDMIADT